MLTEPGTTLAKFSLKKTSFTKSIALRTSFFFYSQGMDLLPKEGRDRLSFDMAVYVPLLSIEPPWFKNGLKFHAQSVIANSFASTKPTSLSLQPRLVVHLPIASPTGQVLSPSRSLPEAKVSTENGLSNSGNFSISTGSITIAIFKPSKAF